MLSVAASLEEKLWIQTLQLGRLDSLALVEQPVKEKHNEFKSSLKKNTLPSGEPVHGTSIEIIFRQSRQVTLMLDGFLGGWFDQHST